MLPSTPIAVTDWSSIIETYLEKVGLPDGPPAISRSAFQLAEACLGVMCTEFGYKAMTGALSPSDQLSATDVINRLRTERADCLPQCLGDYDAFVTSFDQWLQDLEKSGGWTEYVEGFEAARIWWRDEYPKMATATRPRRRARKS